MSDICERLHRGAGKLPRLRAGSGMTEMPSNGVYFLFEKGEHAHGGERVVRIGTHTGDNNLRKRLEEHFHTRNKDRSIFRKHIGRCLLRRDKHPYVDLWEYDLTRRADRASYEHLIDHGVQKAIEDEVTCYMTENFSFSVIELNQKADRLCFEKKLISTLSSCSDCVSSPGWLGRCHPKTVISSKGLWNVQGHGGKTGKTLSGEDIQNLFGT